MFHFCEINNENRNKVKELIIQNWGSPIIISRGRKHEVEELSGFLLHHNGDVIGLITYCISDNSCEIVSLNSFVENQGVGSELIEKVIEIAKEYGCKRVWLITTNDNIRALRFYQKRGFDIKALHLNVIEEARRIKPDIPMYGNDDIPILHEIEFEKKL